MVKADLSRDYYGDLEISPNADIAEIKKQFKKLALTYHPDRNPGRESEVTAKFQRIQSAHEVLTDASERAKYDANRVRIPSNSFRNSYAGGTSSGVRGNPWSNVSSQFPTPPKPPTARNRQPNKQPPPSSGAQRYQKFSATPNTSAYQAQNEGPQARKETFEAWENLRHAPKPDQGGPGKPRRAPQPPPRGPQQFGREETNARTQAPPPRSYQNFDDPQEQNSPPRRSRSTNAASNRKGFMPNTPSGDEPPAPMNNYFTQRNKPTAPPPPPRSTPSVSNVAPDPLRQFREQAIPDIEPRLSTPYATHGGEKLNPFESTNINRARSTRERNGVFDSKDGNSIPRSGSDPHLSSPQRTRSNYPRKSPRAPKETIIIDSSSSEDMPRMNFSGTRQSSRGSGATAPQAVKPDFNATARSETSSKQSRSKISQFRQWMQENPGQEPPPDGFPPDGPPLRSDQTNSDPTGKPSIFTFPVNDETFIPTQPRHQGFSNSAENISTTFSAEDWDGKFEAGGDYFKPEPKASSPIRSRTQSGSRTRARSPTKTRSVDPQYVKSTADKDAPPETPGARVFSPEEWNETFKPQTFMPPPNPSTAPPRPGRKRTAPSIRPTMGGNAAVVIDDSETPDEKPLFTGRKNMSSQATPRTASPEPMDVDTPPVAHTVPQFEKSNEELKVDNDTSNRPAVASVSQSPTDTEDLKVNFDDLKIQDLITTLNMPAVPQLPTLPETSNNERPSRSVYEAYKTRFAMYMGEWELFNAKFLLHMVARRNQNEMMGENRWLDEKLLETYRLGLKEDQAVLKRWSEARELHEVAVKDYVVVREKMNSNKEMETSKEQSEGLSRPRKKTH